MRTLSGEKLNYKPMAAGQSTDSFKNETEPYANDGTQLVENCGLPDIYYAMVTLIKMAGIRINNLPENTSDTSQIIQAMQKLFANRAIQDDRYSSFNDKYPDSNRTLRSDIVGLSNDMIDVNRNLRSLISEHWNGSDIWSNSYLSRRIIDNYNGNALDSNEKLRKDINKNFGNATIAKTNEELAEIITKLQNQNLDNIKRKVFDVAGGDTGLPGYTIFDISFNNWNLIRGMSCMRYKRNENNALIDMKMETLQLVSVGTNRRAFGIPVPFDESRNNFYIIIDYIDEA